MSSIFNELKAGKLQPAYLLYGSEFYLMQRARDEIVKLALQGADKSLNYDHFSGTEPNAAKDAVTAAHNSPFVAARRVVLLTEVEKAWNYEDRKNKVKGKDFLLNYLAAPLSTTVFVMTSEEAPPKELVQATARVGRVEELKPPAGTALKRWIKTLAHENGKDIDDEATALLAQLVGPDLMTMSQEIQKAALYAANRKKITKADVIATGIKHRAESIFTLIDLVANKEAQKALKLLGEILSYEKPSQILWFIARQIRILWHAKKLGRNGYTPSQIVKQLGLPPFLATRIHAQMQKFSSNQLKEAICLCADTDRKFKSTPIPQSFLLERLILEICWMQRD